MGSKRDAELSEPERVVLAVEAIEREVNNGGYEQFFGNSSPEHTGSLMRDRGLIGCPKVARISADAVAVSQWRQLSDAWTAEDVASEISYENRGKLGEGGFRYYANDESVEKFLLADIKEHQLEIRIQYDA